MQMKRAFYTTLSLFTVVWAFTAIDTHFIVRQSPVQSIDERYAMLAGRLPATETSRGAVKSMQVAEIDQQIEELEEMKRGFEARALRHEDQAQRLQFEDRALLETRRHNELAAENRAKAQRVQEEIDRLQTEKKKLLQRGYTRSTSKAPKKIALKSL
ncbi:MAG: hypothetical protein HY861_01445 [Chlamydiia bacterium]|nr:hypothetical protein [Chlamydiia bacterium]